MNPTVDWYFVKEKKWKEELTLLREELLSCGLSETLKWGHPCYTLHLPTEKKDANVVLIHSFKTYCAVLFFKGALIEDKSGVLIQQTANVQAARQMRFTGTEEVQNGKALLKKYVLAAVKIEKAGLKVPLKQTKEFEMPDEFIGILKEHTNIGTAFKKLTPGRQRAYLLYFSSAKQSATRTARIKKCIPKILDGKGLDD
jgi:uncharacterized protein YdeI (YjbR/CyaY-like superfamily)